MTINGKVLTLDEEEDIILEDQMESMFIEYDLYRVEDEVDNDE